MTSLTLLGVLLIYVAIAQPPTPVWQVFLIVVGLAALWCADAMRKATASQVVLTETELRDGDGTLIAPLEDVIGVDRGFFAFKPSNGFLLKTRSRAPRRWRPGLWWRIGNRVGVGGMTAAHQAKNMSEILAIILARRDMSP
nr:hypothetical protein [Sulfitobacter aestuariivivens]